MAITTINAETLAKMFLAGAANLDAKKEWINDLNVFPVPDGDTGANMTLTIMSASFQSVTLRTAGFSTVAPAHLTDSSALLGCVLMLIGGSPGSTAGGIKTTSFMILILGVFSIISKRDSITAFKRRLPHGYLSKVLAILTMYLFFALLSVGIICAVDPIQLRESLFQVFSAIGTVGVDMTDTGALSNLPKIILSILMFFGRIGGLSLALAFSRPVAAPPVKYPTEKISVG